MNDVYTAAMRDIAPIGAPVAYTDPKQIDRLLRSTDPELVAASGRSYQDFAEKYGTIADHLYNMREDLLEAWNGEDAAAAQSQLREVWVAATAVQGTASSFGIAVERHGSESLYWYKNQMPPTTSLSEAQTWMTGANDRISESWNALPVEISTKLPPPPKQSHHGSPTDPRLAAGGGSAGGGSLPDGPSPLSTGAHHTSGGPLSGDGADLAGFSSGAPPSLSSGLSMGGPGGGLTTGGPLATPPGLGGVGGLGGAGGLQSGGVIGRPGALPTSAAQSAAAAEEAAAAETSAAARSGLMGPVIGGGAGAGGQQEQERRRETWLAEDDETWASDEVAPQVIGNEEPEPEHETPTEIDLSSDDDIADILNELDEEQPSDPAAEIAALRAKLERLERQIGSDKTTESAEDDSAGGLGWMAGEDI